MRFSSDLEIFSLKCVQFQEEYYENHSNSYEGLERSLEQCQNVLKDGRTYALGDMGNLKTLKGLPEGFRQQYRNVIAKIEHGNWNHQNLTDALITGFRDYSQGECTFEECIPNAIDEVDRYLSE